jgi:hypothetical protein
MLAKLVPRQLAADPNRAAMRIMDRVKREGRKVTSFVSWCGGLPEPSASNVCAPYPRQTLQPQLIDFYVVAIEL